MVSVAVPEWSILTSPVTLAPSTIAIRGVWISPLTTAVACSSTRSRATMAPLTSEPYGIGVNKDQKDLARYVNRVLDTIKADGTWKTSYDRWFAEALGPAPQPPQPVYGRG